jgi:hypothetical protein
VKYAQGWENPTPTSFSIEKYNRAMCDRKYYYPHLSSHFCIKMHIIKPCFKQAWFPLDPGLKPYGVHTSPICKGFKLSILFPPHSQAEPGNALREASPPVTPIDLSLWGFVPRLCLGTMKPALGILVCTP